MDILVDPAISVAVWGVIFVLRGLVPAKLVSIDGKETLWTMAVAGAALVLVARGDFNDLDTVQDIASSILSVFTTAAGAVLTDGAAKKAGLSESMRRVVTLGGRTNAP